MITTCIFNGIKDIRVFISESNINEKIKFTYVLFTPLYTAIYNGRKNTEECKPIFNTLSQCQEQCNHKFRIQVFDKLFLDSETNRLVIGTETNVI